MNDGYGWLAQLHTRQSKFRDLPPTYCQSKPQTISLAISLIAWPPRSFEAFSAV